MSSVAKVIEIIASSDKSFEDAVSNGVEKQPSQLATLQVLGCKTKALK